MKRNILILINGFGVSQPDSYDVYSAELMPNMDIMTKENIFVTSQNKFLDYKAAYRNFSIGINEPLTYGIIDNNINNNEYTTNQVFRYLNNEMMKNKSRLHIFCYWENEKMIPQLQTYISEIRKYSQEKIFIHIILCQNSLNEFKELERGFMSLNYELGENVKIGLVIGEGSLTDYTGVKDIVRNLITEFGEKWKDINKRLDVLKESKTLPRDTRTFSVNTEYSLEETDQFLFFNYSTIDISMIKKELLSQKYKQLDFSKIKMYSLFPIKSDVQVPFMYNYALSSTHLLSSLNSIGATSLILDLKERCPYINYYITGLKNDKNPSIKYIATDDGFIYDSQKVLDVINGYKEELIIINYELESSKTVEELKDRLSKIDNVIGVLKKYVLDNQAALFVTSLYGMQKDMYDEKQVLRNINFYSKVPLLIADRQLNLSQYSVNEGSLFDLSNAILKNINPSHKTEGLIKKKSSLLSFLYKKPKEIKNETKPTAKRIFAYIIDFIFITIISSLFSGIPLINPNLDKYLAISETYTNLLLNSEAALTMTSEELTNISYTLSYYGVYTSIISLVITTLYFVIFQYYNQGKTIGKALMKIKVIDKSGKKLRLSQMLLRSILINSILTTTILIIMISSLSKTSYLNYSGYIDIINTGILFLTIAMVVIRDDGRGFHDVISDTIVINEIEENLYIEKNNEEEIKEAKKKTHIKKGK